jgi:Flp pilus assembly protein TadD
MAYSAPALAELSEAGYVNLLIAGSSASAMAELEEWVEHRPPRSAAGWGVVALARRTDGRSGEAVRAVEQGLELAESADLYNLLGVLRVERGDRAGAREAWAKALELDPDHGPARANLDEHPEGP